MSQLLITSQQKHSPVEGCLEVMSSASRSLSVRSGATMAFKACPREVTDVPSPPRRCLCRLKYWMFHHVDQMSVEQPKPDQI